MTEPKAHHLKHLDYIQAVITRMAQHSFTLKGWCISLVLAFIAVLLKEGIANPLYWTPPIPIIFCFWGLDAYYVRREKLFRALYDKASHDAVEQKTTYNMILDVSFLPAPSWKRTLLNHTVWPIYIAPCLLIGASVFLLSPRLANESAALKGDSSPAVRLHSKPEEIHADSAGGSRKPFEEVFDNIVRTAPPEQRYRLLYALPKGADLHNHLNLSILPEAWLNEALKAEQTHGNIFYTRTKLNGCKDGQDPPILYRTIQRATYQRLSDCQRIEYEPLTKLSPAAQTEWLSAMSIDKPDEGRDEFFEVLSSRLGDLGRDPYLVSELLVDNMRRFGAEGVRYLEVQVVGPRFLEKDGNPIDEERGAQLLAARLSRPDAKATGVTVRLLASVVRFLPSAEQDLERAFGLVRKHPELWVGVSLTGREDKPTGPPTRFLETLRKLRRSYGEINLAFHGGESEKPGYQVMDTLILGASRIGHALNLISDPSTLVLLRGSKYLIETSLLSNRILGYVPDISIHPFAEYLRLGIPICLNTDDRGAWNSNITDEYYTAVSMFRLRWEEITTLGRNSITFSFADPTLKKEMLSQYERALQAFQHKCEAPTWQETVHFDHIAVSKYARENFVGLSASVRTQ